VRFARTLQVLVAQMIKSLYADGKAGSMSVTKGTGCARSATQCTRQGLSQAGGRGGAYVHAQTLHLLPTATGHSFAGGTSAGDIAVDEEGRVYVGAIAAGSIYKRPVRRVANRSLSLSLAASLSLYIER
jgi:hypothetical protein